MRVFLDYIKRRSESNANYLPHPIIRAFSLAIEALEQAQPGESMAGISQEGTDESVFEPYVVVVKKHEDESIEVLEIRNLKVDKTLPVDVMIMLFRLQIHLDKIEGDDVNMEQAAKCLNAVFPEAPFFALGDRWTEARDKFRERLKEGSLAIPPNPSLREAVTKIRWDTPWEEYPSDLRAMIGGMLAEEVGAKIVLTSPKDALIEKYKVFDMATEFVLGQTAEYLHLVGNRDSRG